MFKDAPAATLTCGVRVSPAPWSLWAIQCSLPGGKCLPDSRNMPGKSARCLSQHLWAVVNWGLMSLPPESHFSCVSSRYSGHHCALGGLWGFSESIVAGLSVLITDREPEPHSAHSGALDGTNKRFSSQRKINLCWFYIIPFLSLIFPCKCPLSFLEKIKQKKRCSW